jgi:hypothetical protein
MAVTYKSVFFVLDRKGISAGMAEAKAPEMKGLTAERLCFTRGISVPLTELSAIWALLNLLKGTVAPD